jgi:hypothetical protein
MHDSGNVKDSIDPAAHPAGIGEDALLFFREIILSGGGLSGGDEIPKIVRKKFVP